MNFPQNIFFDIETIPSQRQEVRARIESKIKPPKITKTGKYKTEDDIADWYAKELPIESEQEYRATALNSALGEIISIAWAIDDRPVRNVCRTLAGSERALLYDFYNIISAEIEGCRPIWVGHYITGFDLRFLWHRSIINNIKPAISIPYNAKPWDGIVFDTKIEWSGLKDSISQDDLCFALGIEGKPDDIDGSKVWDFVKAGNINRVVKYNIDDVDKVRQIYKRMTFAK